MPRTADGHPDLSGVWNGSDGLYPEGPALLPWAAEVIQRRLAHDLQDLFEYVCTESTLNMHLDWREAPGY